MAIKQIDKILSQEFVKQGILTQEHADAILGEIDHKNIPFKDYALEQQYISEEQLLNVFAKLYKLPVLDVSQIQPNQELVKKVPIKFASYYKIVPVRCNGKMVEIASAHPLDVKFQDDIRIHLGLDPKIGLAKLSDIVQAQNRLYGFAADMVDRMNKTSQADGTIEREREEISDIEEVSEDASVTRLVNQILLDAYQKRATDIHIEPYRNKMRLRYRVDGVLMDANIPGAASQFLPSIVSRMKIISNMSIVEKRLPQDGSAVVKTRDQNLDLRISTIPTPRGESMVIRLLPTNVTLLGLDRLGLEPANLKLFRSLVQKPHGIILVTGPTGSGKTTTLYACLTEINNPTRKIITLEDPVEYEMEGITQIQINPKIGFDFATGLRSVLRHDPDIIMVGEVRDSETAEIAIRTALTGHLVLTTLHTNDAASSVTRLVEMGLEPFLVTSSVEAFIAQRLVRLICPHCKTEDLVQIPSVYEEIAASLGMQQTEVKIFRGKGCQECNQTGFLGRTAIYEVLVFNEQLRQAVLDRRNAEDIKAIAMATGMRTLRKDGWAKVVAGFTTPGEVMNVTVKESEEKTHGIKMPEPQLANQESVALSQKTQADQEGQAGNLEVKEHIVQDKILEAKNEYDSRVYARAKIKTNIRYAVYHQDKDDPHKFRTNEVQHSSLTKDLSAGGVRFVSGYALPTGTILNMTIQLPENKGNIHCLAKVCRVEDDAFSAMFYLVAFFLDISSSDRSMLEDFVSGLLKDGGPDIRV